MYSCNSWWIQPYCILTLLLLLLVFVISAIIITSTIDFSNQPPNKISDVQFQQFVCYHPQSDHKTNSTLLAFCCFRSTKLYLTTLYSSKIYYYKSFQDPAWSGKSITSTSKVCVSVNVITADYMNLKLMKTKLISTTHQRCTNLPKI